MGRLTPQTQSNYRCRLRKLRAVLPHMPDTDPEKAKVISEIERLTNKLGLEMTTLEIQLARRPGRPRMTPDIELYQDVIKEVDKEREPTPEEIETARSTFDKLKDKVKQHSPELVDEWARKEEMRKSEEELRTMMELANETLTTKEE